MEDDVNIKSAQEKLELIKKGYAFGIPSDWDIYDYYPCVFLKVTDADKCMVSVYEYNINRVHNVCASYLFIDKTRKSKPLSDIF